jgi:glycosyltransferase involved in cell wall biosynthesis
MPSESPLETPEHSASELRLISIVEAATATGPLKPLLAFSSLVRSGFQGHPPLRHVLMSTRRSTAGSLDADPLRLAAAAAGISFLPIAERGRFDIRVLGRLHQALEAAQPDIVETHNFKSHFLLYLLRNRHRELRRIKWLAFHHGYTRTSLMVRLYQQLDRITLRAADHVVTVCHPFARELIRSGVNPNNLSVLTNFTEPRQTPAASDISATRHELGIDINDCVVLTIGRLSREKGHEDLLTAFRQALSAGPSRPLRLVLVGDGPERSRLEHLAKPTAARVIFTGHLQDPWPLLNAADIFTLPSHSEGSPLVLFEAMSARRPVVASAVGGVPEVLVHGKTGLLVPPGQPAALRDAILALANAPELCDSLSTAAALALRDYTPARYASRLLAIYQAILQKSRSAACTNYSNK